MKRELSIETNGHFYRVVERMNDFTTTFGDPFPTLAEAETFRELYERRFFGEWKPVVEPSPWPIRS
jgi:hypothetical protein